MHRPRTTSAREAFTAKEAARLAGLSLDMLNYLGRYGIAAPSGNERRARGHARRYLYADLLLLRVIARLLENGISVLRLRKALEGLQARLDSTELLTKRFVVTDGYNLLLQDGGVTELLETGQLSFAFVLELSNLRTELGTAIERLSAA
ncbi:MerR family transcriptional regulator [Burkholderia glumae]|uniref:MerR family transcriptional regulator n=1 Tax=Burkholderia glumae TaxID=337 RepID=UPI002149D0E1|nr:MerR family transcriptional regulator [Burkholderia glumae]MCR1770514.1 MerR family transcriptional regulator [Burkholderia glumae]